MGGGRVEKNTNTSFLGAIPIETPFWSQDAKGPKKDQPNFTKLQMCVICRSKNDEALGIYGYPILYEHTLSNSRRAASDPGR